MGRDPSGAGRQRLGGCEDRDGAVQGYIDTDCILVASGLGACWVDGSLCRVAGIGVAAWGMWDPPEQSRVEVKQSVRVVLCCPPCSESPCWGMKAAARGLR